MSNKEESKVGLFIKMLGTAFIMGIFALASFNIPADNPVKWIVLFGGVFSFFFHEAGNWLEEIRNMKLDFRFIQILLKVSNQTANQYIHTEK